MNLTRILSLAVLAGAVAGCEPEVVRPGGTGTFEITLTAGTTTTVSGGALYSSTSGVLVVLTNSAGFDLRMIRSADATETETYLVNVGSAGFTGTVTIRVDGEDHEYLLAVGSVTLTKAGPSRVAGNMNITATALQTGAPYQSITVAGTFDAACSATCFVT